MLYHCTGMSDADGAGTLYVRASPMRISSTPKPADNIKDDGFSKKIETSHDTSLQTKCVFGESITIIYGLEHIQVNNLCAWPKLINPETMT